jgi:hypothetical protein
MATVSLGFIAFDFALAMCVDVSDELDAVWRRVWSGAWMRLGAHYLQRWRKVTRNLWRISLDVSFSDPVCVGDPRGVDWIQMADKRRRRRRKSRMLAPGCTTGSTAERMLIGRCPHRRHGRSTVHLETVGHTVELSDLRLRSRYESVLTFGDDALVVLARQLSPLARQRSKKSRSRRLGALVAR